MYLTIIQGLRAALSAHIREKYGCEISITVERPPKLELGEAASPVCFELAKRLKKAPRQIAQEIAGSLPAIEGIARVEVAGGGYLNAFFDRGAFWQKLWAEATGERPGASDALGRVIVEHTSINPNKAAHIGHLRNAVLGDTMVRMLRHTGHEVAVQNYIDNTGVQVADVVIAFREMEKKSFEEVKKLAGQAGFDYLCWDLYAKATQFFEEEKTRAAELRGETLKAIEEGKGEIAEMATVIADAIVSLHLRTMARLDIFYELLARESEILHLHFWDAAFEKLKASGAIQLATSGKNAGCWIMPWGKEGKEGKEIKDVKEVKESAIGTDSSTSFTSYTSLTSCSDEEDQAKIIVRSNGTVTYVGKDIAYQLWKFGLLSKDFRYRKWPAPPDAKTVWATTTEQSDPGAPHFGDATAVYNVIDTRQAYLQEVVAEGLRALGHTREAENSIHFDYQIVALTPRCAAELGYEIAADEARKAYVEVSGRKGHGVKADDLITRMWKAAEERVRQKHPQMAELELRHTANALAVGALRFFLLKFTRNTIIAFDFDDALSAEGETGPYCQYAVVRIRGIRRKGMVGEDSGLSEEEVLARSGLSVLAQSDLPVSQYLSAAEDSDIWTLLVQAGLLDQAVDAGIRAQEPAFVAKYAFELAQGFNVFYHKHHILSETDERKRVFLLGLTELVEKQMVRALRVLGIEAPEKM
ncbi:MAG TPA: arginine--tRNA ligase [Candidatus Dormibacteraeota bacterium]|nr:arginine--tRNA ligase [Candidatus Dormibacteraeota bacterium]